MLLTNQQLDKLAASCIDFSACGMLMGPLLTSGLNNEPRAEATSNFTPDARGDEDDEAAGGIASMGDVKLAWNPGKHSTTWRSSIY
jgi:hypothetical protein